MLTDLKNWIAQTLGTDYRFFFGMWVESETDADISYCVIQAAGGNAPIAEDRRPKFRVILLGKRNGNDADKIYSDAQSLMTAIELIEPPCNYASVSATAEPTGPAFTTENRAFMQLGFQMLF